MKTPASFLRLPNLFLGCLALLAGIARADQNLAGNVTITGGATGNLFVTGYVDADANSFTFGTQGGNPGVSLNYFDDAMPGGTNDTFKFTLARTASSWLWAHATDGTNPTGKAMRLDSSHILTVFKVDGTSAGIVLNPGGTSIGIGSASITSQGAGVLTTSGAFTVTGAFTPTGGITGPTSGSLNLSASGSNQNVKLLTTGTGKVGIGITPVKLLHVHSATSTESAALFTHTGSGGTVTDGLLLQEVDANASLTNNEAGYLSFGTSAAERLRIDASGNLGIGTTTPTSLLTVSSDTASVLGEFLSFNNTGFGILATRRARGTASSPTATQSGDYLGAFMASGRNSGGWNTGNAGMQLIASENHTSSAQGNAIQFFTTANGAATATTKMTIDNAGNVGIGTAAPSTKLELKGANVAGKGLLYVNGDDHGFVVTNSPTAGVTGIAFAKNGTTNWSTGMAASDASYYIAEGTSIGSNQRLAIAAGGSVGIGTSTPDAGTKLHVAGGILTSAAFSSTTGSTGGFDYYSGGLRLFSMGSSGATKGTYTFMAKGADGSSSTPMTIDAGGNVGIGLTSPTVKLDVSGDAKVSGNLTVQGSFSAANLGTGTLTGGASGLSLGAGGTDQSIVLTPTGTGKTVINGNVGIGTTGPDSKLQIDVATNKEIRAAVGSSSALADFSTGGSGLFFSRGSDGADNISGIFQYTDGSGNNRLALATRDDLVFAVGGPSTYSAAPERMRIASTGNVGIGTTNPTQKLTIAGNLNMSGSWILGNSVWANNTLEVHLNGWDGSTNGSYGHIAAGHGYYYGGLQSGGGGGNEASSGQLYVAGTSMLMGNVGIGITNPTHKLAVAGTIRAFEVIVDTGWADYVFDDDYRLAPLAEVEQHIKEKKHLPGIPSAAEVAEHGVSMGDMQAKLLSKVEELTLHLIRMEKENAALRDRVQVLETAAVAQ